MNTKSAPFLLLLLPFALGIALGSHFRDLPSAILPALGAMSVGLVFLHRRNLNYRFRWFFGALCMTALFLMGFVAPILHDERHTETHFANKNIDIQCFIAEITDVPSAQAKVKVTARLLAAGPSADSLLPCTGNALLYLEADSLSLALQYGDRIAIVSPLRPTEPPKNPHAFDYGRYLHFQNIHHTAFVGTGKTQLLSNDNGHLIWKYAFICRAKLLEILRLYFPTDDEYAVASALLVGYKDDLSEDLRTAYAETGSMHALAVSGTHVGFLYLGLMWLLRRVPVYGYRGKLFEIITALVAIWLFTFLTGASASVLRASVMFSIYLVGEASFRHANSWNILGTSAFFLLLLNPYYLFDAGFQLSYSAVAGMLFFYPLFYKRSKKRGKWADLALQTLFVGFAAQLGTLPLSLYYFHQFPVYFWLAGWIVVFGGAVFLGGGALLVFLHLCLVWTPIDDGVGKLLYWMLLAMNKIIIGIQQLPGSVLSGIWLTTWAAFLLLVSIAFFGAALQLKKARPLLVAMSIAAFLLICNAFRATQQAHQRQITVYSMGGGLRLIDFFDGARTYYLSDLLSKKQVQFTAQGNRWANGQIGPGAFESREGDMLADNFRYAPPLLQFYGEKMAFVNRTPLPQTAPENPISVKALVLSNNTRTNISDCLPFFAPQIVIIDPSNGRKRTQAWQAECTRLGLPCHDVRNQGAWVYSF